MIDKYHILWLKNQDALLSPEELQELLVFEHKNTEQIRVWEGMEANFDLLSEEEFKFTDGFEDKVLLKMKSSQISTYDRAYQWVVYSGLAASILLMLNLFLAQDSFSIDALIGLADLSSENSSVLYYLE